MTKDCRNCWNSFNGRCHIPKYGPFYCCKYYIQSIAIYKNITVSVPTSKDIMILPK